MKLAAFALGFYGLIILAMGVLALVETRSFLSLAAAAAACSILAISGFFAARGNRIWAAAGGAQSFLLAIYFAYRFIVTERFLPSGVLLLISFGVLFFVLLGIFLGLQHQDEAAG